MLLWILLQDPSEPLWGAKFSEGVRVSHLLFADDTVPVANTPELLQVCL